MTRILLTGAGGFLGSHCLEYVLENTGWDVIATDSFRNKGLTDRISYVLGRDPAWRSRVEVVTHDLRAPFSEQMIMRMGGISHVLAFASESDVPRSIADPVAFIRNNMEIALTTLELCRRTSPETVVWVSTDEVYGCGGMHEEWDTPLPSNPYSASKAAQESIAVSYWRTFGLPVVIVNCVNGIGERQDPEKFLPLLMRKIASGDTVEVHGTREQVGSRRYVHAQDLASAIVHITAKLPAARFGDGADRPDKYHVAGSDPVSNLELIRRVAEIMDRPLRYELAGFPRPGHDITYGMCGAKLAAAGWVPLIPPGEALRGIVEWTLAHPEWLA